MMKTFLVLHLILLWALNAASPILTPNGPVYIMNGGSLALTCEIDQDAAVVNWIRNGFTNLQITNTSACSFRKLSAQDTYNYSMTCVQQRKFTMVKYKVNSSDYNTAWSCQIYSVNYTDLGTSLVVKVLMHVPVGSVKLMNGSTLTLIEDQSAVLVCETNACRPSAAIYWMKDGENITDYPTNVTAVSVGSDLFVSIGTLTYTGQREDNMKILTCGAYNGLDSVQTSENLTVTIYSNSTSSTTTFFADNSTSSTTTMTSASTLETTDKTECDFELGLGLGFGILCVITAVVVITFKYTGYKNTYTLGLVLGQGLSITFIVCCVIIAILISTDAISGIPMSSPFVFGATGIATTATIIGIIVGLVVTGVSGTTSYKLEFGLELVLGSGIAVIFIFGLPLRKGIPKRVQLGKVMIEESIFVYVIGIIVERLKYKKN